MYRFYCEEGSKIENHIVLTGEDVNHIKNVLRMKVGEQVILCDGKGTDYLCGIEQLNPTSVTAQIEQETQSETELPVRITLFQGLPKKDKMELIIQKAVELGASEIVPVTMKRCVVKLEDEKKEAKKRERWQAIAESAAKQSGRGIIPQVSPAVSYKEALKRAQGKGLGIVPYEKEEGMLSLKNAVQTLKTGKHGFAENAAEEECIANNSGIKEIFVFIGPEGGFEESEIADALAAGITPVSLGKRILRTETAGLTTLSILMYELECME